MSQEPENPVAIEQEPEDVPKISKFVFDDDIAQESTSEDRCAVCLSPGRTDETYLDACIHTFCFSCIREWMKVNETCPVCKASVKLLRHTTDGIEQRMTLQELKEEVEVERISAAAREQPIISERAAVMHHLKKMRKAVKDQETARFGLHQTAYRQAVDAYSSARSLREDIDSGITRVQLMNDARFRRIIYDENLRWSPITRPALATNFSPSMASANEAQVWNRTKPWIYREIPFIASCHVTDALRKELARDIFRAMLSFQINSPNFQSVLLIRQAFVPGFVAHFCELLFEFCASNLSMEAHDGNSSFALDQPAQAATRNNDNGRGTEAPIVVDGDDEDEDIELLSLDGNSSSSDGVHEMYRQGVCRLPRPPPPPPQHPRSLLPFIHHPIHALFQPYSLPSQSIGGRVALRRQRNAQPNTEVVTIASDEEVEEMPAESSHRHQASLQQMLMPAWLPQPPPPESSSPMRREAARRLLERRARDAEKSEMDRREKELDRRERELERRLMEVEAEPMEMREMGEETVDPEPRERKHGHHSSRDSHAQSRYTLKHYRKKIDDPNISASRLERALSDAADFKKAVGEVYDELKRKLREKQNEEGGRSHRREGGERSVNGESHSNPLRTAIGESTTAAAITDTGNSTQTHTEVTDQDASILILQ